MSSILKSRLGRASTIVALAAAGIVAATAADARPWHYWGGGGWRGAGPVWGLGALAGAVTGAAIASSYYHPYYYPPAPAYYYPPPAYRYGYGYGYNGYGYNPGYNPNYGPEPAYGLVVR
jgi:hypothetical protein